MQVRRVFTAGKGDIALAAEVMGKYFFPDENKNAAVTVKAYDFSTDENSFSDLKDEHLESLVFLAHGSSEKYGNHSATEFANLMAKRFGNKDKTKLEDLYLVGCEIGLRDKNGSSMAQKMANELARAGFSKVSVRAFTQPETKQGEVLIVQVQEKSGLTNVEEGVVSVCLLNKKDGSRYLKLDETNRTTYGKGLSTNEKKELQKLKERVVKNSFLTHTDPKTQLDKALNTFKPNESQAVRNQRLAVEIEQQKKDEMERIAAIEKLKQRKVELEKKAAQKKSKVKKFIDKSKNVARGNASKIDALEIFIKIVESAPHDEWKNRLKKAWDNSFFNNEIGGFSVNKKSTTNILIMSLLGESAEETAEKKKSILGDFKAKVEEKVEKVMDALTGSHEKQYQPVSTIGPEEIENSDTRQPEITLADIIKKEVLPWIDHYETKLAAMGCFGFFYNKYEKAKLGAFKRLNGTNTIEELHQAVTEYLADESSNVMYTKNTSITRDALNSIKAECEKARPELLNKASNRKSI